MNIMSINWRTSVRNDKVHWVIFFFNVLVIQDLSQRKNEVIPFFREQNQNVIKKRIYNGRMYAMYCTPCTPCLVSKCSAHSSTIWTSIFISFVRCSRWHVTSDVVVSVCHTFLATNLLIGNEITLLWDHKTVSTYHYYG